MRRFLIAGLVLLACSAQAQTMKPGLWETHQKPQLDPKRQAQLDAAQKQIAAMPPEQRKMMEQMMAQHGVQLDMAGGTITIKACISKEQAERNMAPVTNKGNCTQDLKRDGNIIRSHFSCTDPASEGDSEITLVGGDSYTSKTRITHGTETINVTGDARWLGADCGALKPTATH